jgi:uncharacterized RDD family membrane protein YckC
VELVHLPDVPAILHAVAGFLKQRAVAEFQEFSRVGAGDAVFKLRARSAGRDALDREPRGIVREPHADGSLGSLAEVALPEQGAISGFPRRIGYEKFAFDFDSHARILRAAEIDAQHRTVKYSRSFGKSPLALKDSAQLNTDNVETPQKLDTLQTIELAEGVQVNLHPAGPIPRGIALGVDLVLMVLLIIGMGIAFTFLGGLLGGQFSVGLVLLAAFISYWGYFLLFEVMRRGQTPGKKWMGLRVVRTSGAPVGWGAAFLRNLIRFADMMPLIPQFPFFGFFLFGATSCICTKRFQRLGDLVAETLVIYDRPVEAELSARFRAPVAPAPPPFVLTKEEELAFIQFADRAATLSDSRKEELVKPLAELLGVAGPSAVQRVLGIGVWLRDS